MNNIIADLMLLLCLPDFFKDTNVDVKIAPKIANEL